MSQTRYTHFGLVASLMLHGLVLSAIATQFMHPPASHIVAQPAISVEIFLSPPALANTQENAAPVLASPQVSQPDAVTPVPPPTAPEMIRPTKMLTSAVFADPRNAEARQMLETLGDDTRREQVCGIEAVEQIHAYRQDWQPEGVVAYAFSDAIVTGDVMVADGAAVHIGTQWLELRFVCTLAMDLASVTAFEFSVGAVIPPSEWDAHNLVGVEEE